MFFSAFVPALGEYTNKLFGLLTKDQPDKWPPDHFGPELVEAVQHVNDALCAYPILRMADTNKPFYLLCDSSRVAGAAALCQRDVYTYISGANYSEWLG